MRKEETMYDVIIIGAGVSGTSVAYEMSKLQAKTLLLERENDVSLGTTKANSAIIHAGYDPMPGSLMAKYNVEGNAYIRKLCSLLDIPLQQVGSLVVAYNKEEIQSVQRLYAQGIENKVPGMKILNAEEVHAMEPNINKQAIGALYAPTACIVSPWEMAIAFGEVAIQNGVALKLNTNVTGIKKSDAGYEVITNAGSFETKCIVNATGVYGDQVSEYLNEKSFTMHPSKGQYYLFDKSQGNLVSHIVFQCPNKDGKGVLVAPTVHGNLIVGPNSSDGSCEDVSTTADGLAYVKQTSLQAIPSINYREVIRNFAGIRAKSSSDDFVIGESHEHPGFINMVGMASPGLSSAPAIALAIIKMIRKRIALQENKHFKVERNILRFQALSHEERAKLIAQDPRYGKIVCRCEMISEGEILQALHRAIPCVSLDALKRRCNAGMGRCQGGFCGPRVQEIIAQEQHIPYAKVLLDRAGTFCLTNEIGQGDEE